MTSTEGWETCSMPGCNSDCKPGDRFCTVHNEGVETGEPMNIAWLMLKDMAGEVPPDERAAAQQAAEWNKIQEDEARDLQRRQMEGPECEMPRCRNPAVIERHGENICRECSDAELQSVRQQMRRSMGLGDE